MARVKSAEFHSAEDWCARLTALVDGQSPVVFVVGAGLSRGPCGGVSSVQEILEHVRLEYPDLRVGEGEPARVYQDAMTKLGARSMADTVVRHAVLQAYTGDVALKERALNARGPAQRGLCAELQTDINSWTLPAGVAALADLIARIDRARAPYVRRPCVVTTNFDGLVQIALKRLGISASTHVVDDRIPDEAADAIGVWHVHRYWCADGMRHGAAALERDRPDVEDWLRRRFEDADVCVIGYGGWNDVVFRSARRSCRKVRPPPRLAWAFRDSSPAEIRATYGHVISAIPQIWADSSHFFSGVDVHRDLPDVVRRLDSQSTRTRPHIGAPLFDAVIVCPPEALSWSEHLAACLAANGYVVAPLNANSLYADHIARNAILVVTSDALHSPWVGAQHARWRAIGKGDPTFAVIPIYLQEAEATLRVRQGGISFSNAEEYQKSLRELCGLLNQNGARAVQAMISCLDSPGTSSYPMAPKGDTNDVAFLAHVFDRLAREAILLLAQEDRLSGSAVDTIRSMAAVRYAPRQILNLVPLFSDEATSQDYFGSLGEEAGFSTSTLSSAHLERELRRKLDGSGTWLIILNGIENGSETHGYELAGVIRALHQVAHQHLHLLMLGGPRLMTMHYAGNRLSPLSFATPLEWPELSLSDVRALAASYGLADAIDVEFERLCFDVSGGHPRIIRMCLEHFSRTRETEREEYDRMLFEGLYLRRILAGLANSSIAERIRELLPEIDAGAVASNADDEAIATLYWKNLLRRDDTARRPLFVWRCNAVRQLAWHVFGGRAPSS